MNKDLQTIKLNEIEVHKNKIISAINLEIAKRYYYDDANFLTDFKYDADILKSIELFALLASSTPRLSPAFAGLTNKGNCKFPGS